MIEGSGAGSVPVPLTYGSGPGGLKTYGSESPTLLLIVAVDTFIPWGGFKNKIDAHPFRWIRIRLVPNLQDTIQELQFFVS